MRGRVRRSYSDCPRTRSSPGSRRRSQIIIPLLRGGHATSRGPGMPRATSAAAGRSPDAIPILIGGNGPKRARRSACRHLELLRGGAGACRRARPAPRVARCDLRRDRARPVDDRPVCRRLGPSAGARRAAAGRHLRICGRDRRLDPVVPRGRLHPGRHDVRPRDDGGPRRPGARPRTAGRRLTSARRRRHLPARTSVRTGSGSPGRSRPPGRRAPAFATPRPR